MEMIQVLKSVGVDLDTTLQRFSGNQSLLERFIKKFPKDPTMPRLAEAVAENRYQEIGELAHTLKGTAANLGLAQLSEYNSALLLAVREGDFSKIAPLFTQVQEEYQRLTKAIAQID